MNTNDIWLCELPSYDGREQRGVRPCILLAKPYLELVTVLPLTSQLEALRFNHTLKIVKNELNKLAQSKKAGIQAFNIKPWASPEQIQKCHIVFIAPGESSHINTVIKKIDGFSTLVVAEGPGMTSKGAAINFVIQENRQKFELNKSNAEKYNLKVSSSLEALAIK